MQSRQDQIGTSVNVVIVGCGRVGARIAATLDQAGHRVSVVDSNASAFRRLPQDFSGKAIVGTGIDAVSYTHLTLPTICSV